MKYVVYLSDSKYARPISGVTVIMRNGGRARHMSHCFQVVFNLEKSEKAKRGRASKRAVAELFSNSESAPVNEAATHAESRREALKLEFFKTLPGALPEKSAARDEASDKAGESGAERSENVAKPTVRSAEPRGGAEYSARSASGSHVGGTNFAPGKARPASAVNTQSIPRPAPPKGVGAAEGHAAVGGAQKSAGATAVFPRVKSAQHTVDKDKKVIRTAPSAARSEVKNKETKKNGGKKKKVIAALCSAAALLLITGGALFLFLPREEIVVPADTVAGRVERAGSSSNYISGAEEYVRDDRYDVTFTFYEADDIVCSTSEATVADVMEKMGVVCGENNRMDHEPTDVISEDTVIDIKTLSYTTAYTTESVAYDTEYVDVSYIPRGTTSVKQNGQNGVKTYTYNCTLVNGVEESRELVGEEITENPTTRILYRGVGGTVVSGGKSYSYSYYIDVSATVYTIVGTTASGLPTSTSVMAVDPRVIPLGTRCVVVGGGDYGYRIAADTGGSIKGNKIDLWYPDGTFGGFGWRSTRVYILD